MSGASLHLRSIGIQDVESTAYKRYRIYSLSDPRKVYIRSNQREDILSVIITIPERNMVALHSSRGKCMQLIQVCSKRHFSDRRLQGKQTSAKVMPIVQYFCSTETLPVHLDNNGITKLSRVLTFLNIMLMKR